MRVRVRERERERERGCINIYYEKIRALMSIST